jgi:hypothetical protein
MNKNINCLLESCKIDLKRVRLKQANKNIIPLELDMVAHTYNSSTKEAEFKTSFDY